MSDTATIKQAYREFMEKRGIRHLSWKELARRRAQEKAEEKAKEGK